MIRNILIIFLSLVILENGHLLAQNSITLTYNSGDIPTAGGFMHDIDCNGPTTKLTFTLPAGENINVLGFDVSYDFQSVGTNSAFMQRSAIFCQNNEQMEDFVNGSNNTPGIIENYNRTGIEIANGIYAGGSEVTLEMRAYNSIISSPCGTNEFFIIDNSWTITLYYSDSYATPLVGINTNSPEAVLDVNGKIKIKDDNAPVATGHVRYNEAERDFEGYDGNEWLSFTAKNTPNFTNDFVVPENELSLIPNPNPTDPLFGSIPEEIFSDENLLVASNLNKKYLYRFENNNWELIDSTSASGRIIDFKSNILQLQTTSGIARMRTNGGVFHNYTFEDISTNVDENIRSVEIFNDFCFVGSGSFSTPHIGQVDIFDTTTTPWSHVQTLTPPSTSVFNDNFGVRIKRHHDNLYVGSIQGGINGTIGAGVVYVYKYNTNQWELSETIISPNQSDNWKFGTNIKVRDNELFIGSDPSNNSDNGTIAVYDIQSSGHMFKYEITSPMTIGGFANKFAINNEYLVVSNGIGIASTYYAFMYKKDENWDPIHQFEVDLINLDQIITNVGFSDTQVFLSIERQNNPAEFGIYSLKRPIEDPVPFTDITDFPADLLDGDDVNDADADDSNELITNILLSGSLLSINENGNIAQVSLAPIATQWQNDNSDIYFNNNVGIGVNNPQTALDMNGTLQVYKNSSSGDPHVNLVESGPDFVRFYMENNTGNRAVIASNPKTDTDESIINFFLDGAGDVLTIKGNEMIGINDATPIHTLEANAQTSDDPLMIRTGSTEHLEILENGHLLIGNNVTDESNKLIKVSNGAYLSTGGTWTNASSRDLKQNFEPVVSQDILLKLAALNILKWNYKLDSSAVHLGPIAEEFHETFGLGGNDKSISTVDASGVALVAIQALYEESEKVKKENETLKEILNKVMTRLEALENN